MDLEDEYHNPALMNLVEDLPVPDEFYQGEAADEWQRADDEEVGYGSGQDDFAGRPTGLTRFDRGRARAQPPRGLPWTHTGLIAACLVLVELRLDAPSGPRIWDNRAVRNLINRRYGVLRSRTGEQISSKLKNSWRSDKANIWHLIRPLTFNHGLAKEENYRQALELLEKEMEDYDFTMLDLNNE